MPTMSCTEFRITRRKLKAGTPIEKVMADLGGRWSPSGIEFQMESWRARYRVKRRDDQDSTARDSEGVSADLAFQEAMLCAARKGRETPPGIGIFKDDTPLVARRVYAPSRGLGNSALADA